MKSAAWTEVFVLISFLSAFLPAISGSFTFQIMWKQQEDTDIIHTQCFILACLINNESVALVCVFYLLEF